MNHVRVFLGLLVYFVVIKSEDTMSTVLAILLHKLKTKLNLYTLYFAKSNTYPFHLFSFHNKI